MCRSPLVRRAFSLSLDREGAVRSDLSGHGDPAALPVSPLSGEYSQSAADALSFDLEQAAALLELTQDVLLEVNIGGEQSKSGFAPEALYGAAERARTFASVRVMGLMTIPPAEREPHGNLPYFTKVSRFYVDISRDLYDNGFKYLSMGMSDDFEDAIAAGATMVRVGSAIFGHRQYQ